MKSIKELENLVRKSLSIEDIMDEMLQIIRSHYEGSHQVHDTRFNYSFNMNKLMVGVGLMRETGVSGQYKMTPLAKDVYYTLLGNEE